MPSEPESDDVQSLLCDAYTAPPLDREFSADLIERLQAEVAPTEKQSAQRAWAVRCLLCLAQRRRFQFGLRAVLIVMLLIGVSAFLFIRPYQVQQNAARRIRELGGSVVTGPGGPAWFREWFGGEHLRNVVQIDIVDGDDPAEYMDYVLCCPELEVLVVGGQKFTDRELLQLASLEKLRGLVLDTTSHTKAGLANLKSSLPKLETRYSWRRAEVALSGVASFKVGTYRPLNTRRLVRKGAQSMLGGVQPLIERFETLPLPFGGPDWLRKRTQDKYFKDLIFVRFNKNATDKDIEWLPKLPGYQAVSLYGSQVTDRGLARLVDWGSRQIALEYQGHACPFSADAVAKLAKRKRSWWMIRGVPLGEHGLAFLQGQSELSELGLEGTGISDDQLRHLSQLPLRELFLDNNPIGDDGLKFLPADIRALWLRNTRITDAGMEHLKRLKMLRHLKIYGTKVTDDGVQALKQSLPGCYVDRQSRG